MNTRVLRGIRKLRDATKELNGKYVEVKLVGDNSEDEFSDKVFFSLAPDSTQDVLITGAKTKLEVRLSGDSIRTVRRLNSGGFRIKLNDKKFKFLFLIPAEEVQEEGGE